MSDLKEKLKEYLREAIIWRQLKHPNLVPFLGLYYLDDTQQRMCLVSPWMENGNLVEFLRRQPPEAVDHIQLMYDITNGLSHLHASKIVHGDLKGVRHALPTLVCLASRTLRYSRPQPLHTQAERHDGVPPRSMLVEIRQFGVTSTQLDASTTRSVMYIPSL
ncbi:hypothetical protein VNI00_011109 [Paramarasmius palmivorus]|uniref:Protein kinase domain-containing protein n=1 Tax=Paramarasmius palmivorus TaxID=297713 RepID=A0AAW0CH52_9AGAR